MENLWHACYNIIMHKKTKTIVEFPGHVLRENCRKFDVN